MPNVAAALREEIARVSRKEIRKLTDTTRRAAIDHRRDIAELKRQIQELQRTVALLESKVLADIPSQVKPEDAEDVRFTAKGLRSSRKRLGLSAEDFGKLMGVSDQTVYNWERGRARPRKPQIATYAAVRSMGKREALARLEKMTAE
jgi:DNA-binding transcriptional regulator YiaG